MLRIAMPRLTEEDLASLYPKPKSFDEVEAERKFREIGRRPRFVPAKISAWTTLGIAVVLAAQWLGSNITIKPLASVGDVLLGVTTSTLLILTTMVSLYYLYTLISTLIQKTPVSIAKFYTTLTLILVIAGFMLTLLAQYQLISVPTLTGVLLFNFLTTYFAASFIIKKDSTTH